MQWKAILIIITMNFILFKYQYTTAIWAIGGHVYVYKTCMLKKKTICDDYSRYQFWLQEILN